MTRRTLPALRGFRGLTRIPGQWTALALAGVLAATLATPAQADQALATAKACMSCHSIDKKVVGPSFKEIAARYANDKAAADRLASKIVKGGGGNWGAVAMPANAQVTPDEAKRLSTWVLSLR